MTDRKPAPELTDYPGTLGKTRILKFPTEDAWLEARKQYVTASDAATLFIDEIEEQGESCYNTPYSLGLEKLGMLDKEWKESERRRNWFATRMEEVAGAYWREYDPCLPTFRFTGYHLIVHDDYPALAATDDFMTVFDDGQVGPLEIKAPGEWNAKEWKDSGAPLKFLIQNNIQMLLTGCTRGAVFGIVGGNTPHHVFTEFDEGLCAIANARAEDFMARLKKGEVPSPDGRERTTKALKLLHPKDSGATVQLPDAAEQWFEALDHWEAVKKQAETEVDHHKNLLRHALGDATYGEYGPLRVSWKTSGGNPMRLNVPLTAQAALDAAGVPYEVNCSPESRRLTRRKAK